MAIQESMKRDPLHWFEVLNYDKNLGKVRLAGYFGRMKLVELDYDDFKAKYLMLDDNRRVQWTTFEYMLKHKFYSPFTAWFLNIVFKITHW